MGDLPRLPRGDQRKTDCAWTSMSIAAAVALAADMPYQGNAFHIDTPGTLVFVDMADQEVTLPSTMMSAGAILLYQAKRVKAGTTATGRVLLT